MTKLNQIWKCEICGNVVEVIHDGADSLVCCGKSMKLLTEKSVDLDEKHKPVIVKNEEGVEVKVGSVEHPMTDEHYIEWIEISTEKGVSKKFLSPENKPESKFPVKAEHVKSRAYCNIHGIWVGELNE